MWGSWREFRAYVLNHRAAWGLVCAHGGQVPGGIGDALDNLFSKSQDGREPGRAGIGGFVLFLQIAHQGANASVGLQRVFFFAYRLRLLLFHGIQAGGEHSKHFLVVLAFRFEESAEVLFLLIELALRFLASLG